MGMLEDARLRELGRLAERQETEGLAVRKYQEQTAAQQALRAMAEQQAMEDAQAAAVASQAGRYNDPRAMGMQDTAPSQADIDAELARQASISRAVQGQRARRGGLAEQGMR